MNFNTGFSFAILFYFSFILLHCAGQKSISSSLNDTKTKLLPCPKSPNCVGTFETKGSKKMDALLFDSDLPTAIQRMDSILQKFSNVTLLSKSERHLHYTFKTKLGGFKDDVEFLFDPTTKKIHFRSASRKGWSDAGANKRRMKKISKQWKS